jgi:hypothetical protein
VVDISLDKPALLVRGGVIGRVARVRTGRVVVVVGPLREVVGELEAARVGGCVLEVDDYELFVLVGGLEERGLLVVGAEAEDVAVLSLGLGG